MNIKRKHLGESLDFAITHRLSAKYTLHHLSRDCGATADEIKAWRAGKVIPNDRQWRRLVGVVRSVLPMRPLRDLAIAEAHVAEREQQAAAETKMKDDFEERGRRDHEEFMRGVEDQRRISAKHAAEDAATAPPPPPPPPPPPLAAFSAYRPARFRLATLVPVEADHQTKSAPESAYGSHLTARGDPFEARERTMEREDFARGVFEQRPHASLTGKDGVQRALLSRFGRGLSTEKLGVIRNEVLVRQGHRPNRSKPKGETMAETPKLALVPRATTPEQDITAAIQLVMDAVPGLRTFTITVDDAGEASCDYTTRQVKVIETGGRVKVAARQGDAK